ncbi:MAG: heme-binding domain-containing protein [Bacteroidales bacterium]
MSTLKKIVLGITITVFTFIATYRIIVLEPTKGLSTEVAFYAIIKNSGCIVCHNSQGQLPYYANWPIVGKKIRESIAKGVEEIDVKRLWLIHLSKERIDSAALTKIERAIEQGHMPPFSYTILRPGSALNKKSKIIIKEWIEVERERLLPLEEGL